MELVSRERKNQLLQAERETECAGGTPLSQIRLNSTAFQPELERQAHVRQLSARELPTVGLEEARLACSFQAEDLLLLDLVRESGPDVPVLILDTSYHFQKTYEHRDCVAAEWRIHLIISCRNRVLWNRRQPSVT